MTALPTLLPKLVKSAMPVLKIDITPPQIMIDALQLFADGAVYKDVESKLNLTHSQLNTYMKTWMTVLNVHTTTGLVAWGFRNGVLK